MQYLQSMQFIYANQHSICAVVAAKNDRDKSAEILAAVGAGMVPATMAMIMPMVLGRKRRYIVDNSRHYIRLRRQATQFNAM